MQPWCVGVPERGRILGRSAHALAGLAVVALLVAQTVFLGDTCWHAAHLRPATAVVVARGGMLDAYGTIREASLRYRYMVGSTRYASDAYGLPGWVPANSWAGPGDAFARATHPGTHIAVWYDPLLPSHGVISRAPPVQWAQAWLAVLGAVGLWLSTRAHRGTRHAQGLGAGMALGSGLGAVLILVGGAHGAAVAWSPSRWLLLALGVVALTAVALGVLARSILPALAARLRAVLLRHRRAPATRVRTVPRDLRCRPGRSSADGSPRPGR